MIDTYPLCDVFLKKTDKKAYFRRSLRNLKKGDSSSLDSDHAQLSAFGAPEGEEDNYYLSRMIYTL